MGCDFGYNVPSALVICEYYEGSMSAGSSLLAVVLASGYGATDEFHQRFVHGRSPDVHDWIADTLGALAGAFVVVLASWVARRRAV